MTRTCARCADGWICEQHPKKPWPHGDCAGPGKQCDNPACPWWANDPPRALLLDRSFVGNPDRETLGGLLQALEHLMEAVEAGATMSAQLIKAQKAGKPLAPKTLAHYEAQLATFDQQRQHFRELIARWWTLLEERPN